MSNSSGKDRIYTDTSVLGGCMDDEFSEWSKKLVGEFRSGEKIAVVSDVMEDELLDAPDEISEILFSIPDEQLEHVQFTQECEELANKYLEEEVVGKGNIRDAQHIAIATVNRVDYLVSWNFRDIVNVDRINGYNGVNLKTGYPTIGIRSPREVIHAED